MHYRRPGLMSLRFPQEETMTWLCKRTARWWLGARTTSASAQFQVAAGGSHSLALKADGSVVAWGSNDRGQEDVPSGLSNVVAIAASGSRSLALTSEGTVVTWGTNFLGLSTVPTNLDGIVGISAGVYHTLALRFDGQVLAWGYNSSG